MRVRVTFLAQLRAAAGCAHLDLDLPGPVTLEGLVLQVAASAPGLSRYLLRDGRMQPSLLAFQGEEQLESASLLEDGAEVVLMTPIAGGSGLEGPPSSPITGGLSDEEKAIYEWQSWVRGFGWQGQEKLKKSSVLISRVGGVGGVVALQLAAAGVGRLILAHAGALRPGDLNRQVLMSHAGIGQPRVEQAAARLRALNPWVEVVAVPENISDENADRLMKRADLAVGCAPRFSERLALNRAAVRQGKTLVDCAMWEMEVQVLVIAPGASACLECLYPEEPPTWTREFPVLGAVASVAGSFGATEAIKVLTGLESPLVGRILLADLRTMSFRHIQIRRARACRSCGEARIGLEKNEEPR
jgi:molybdopterin/thiamine biosynthesis adenylyltransferase/molybdopterin converting factor small subunit